MNSRLIARPASTYLMEMSGRALEAFGIFAGDLLIVDRARKPKDGSVVIAEYQGEFICRVLKKGLGGGYRLVGQGVAAVDVNDDVRVVASVPYSVRRLP